MEELEVESYFRTVIEARKKELKDVKSNIKLAKTKVKIHEKEIKDINESESDIKLTLEGLPKNEPGAYTKTFVEKLDK